MPRNNYNRLTKSLIDRTAQTGFLWDSEVRGFGVRTTATGVKSFILQYRTLKGNQGKLTLGRFPTMTVEEARKIAREHRVAIDKGGDPSRERKAIRASATLADYADFYCDVYGAEKPLRPATISEARRVLKMYALPRFGRAKIADISTSDVRTMFAAARKGSGDGQANKLRAVLSRIFTLAIADEARVSNPCRGVEKCPDDPRWQHLSPEQVRRLLASCATFPDQDAANAVRLLLFTGARKGEALKATWDQFDLEQGIWTKPSAHTKQKKLHRVAIAPEAVDLLSKMRENRQSNYVFPGRDPAKPRHDLKRPWSALLKAAEIGHFRLHDLRRTTASFMLSTQSDLATVGKALGHTQAQTTLRYANLHQTVQRAGSARAVQAMVNG